MFSKLIILRIIQSQGIPVSKQENKLFCENSFLLLEISTLLIVKILFYTHTSEELSFISS